MQYENREKSGLQPHDLPILQARLLLDLHVRVEGARCQHWGLLQVQQVSRAKLRANIPLMLFVGDRYDPNKPVEDDGDASKAKQELDRYLHFYQRYHNHNNAQTFAIDQRDNTEKRMVEMQEVRG
jgi:hypothetical protein